MPDRLLHTRDNFYRKSQLNIEFDATGPVEDEEALGAAVIAFLTAMQEETDLKVSAFYDIVWIQEPEEEGEATATIEFVVYNKLGVTAVSKLRRFMGDHISESMRIPRVTLHGDGESFVAHNFRIQYLFIDFVYRRGSDDWDRLRELLAQEDRGYNELIARQPKEARYIDIEAACAHQKDSR